MKKKYNLPEENKEENVIKEPMVEYRRTPTTEYPSPPCPPHLADTPENIKKVALTGLQQIKNGQFKTHEETLKEFDIE